LRFLWSSGLTFAFGNRVKRIAHATSALSGHSRDLLRECRLARMSDGHYCFVRDLGPVKGGKGMRHHEVIIDFNRRGIMKFLTRLFARPRKAEREGEHELELSPVKLRMHANHPEDDR
jgi:hypothetical protein